MSYVNAIMYSKVLPMIGDGEEEEDTPMSRYDDKYDASVPGKFEIDGDEEIVRG